MTRFSANVVPFGDQEHSGDPNVATTIQEAPVRLEREDAVLRIVLDNPARRNALSDETMALLQQYLEEAAEDPVTQVIVIAAIGPAFCSGHDLKEMQSHRQDEDEGAGYFKDLFERCSELMMTIVRHPKPIIAEINGVATAAGCQLVASCDLAFASNTSTFSTPGVKIGLFCSTPMVALSRAIPRKRAMCMLLTGEMVPADMAAQIGLINRSLPAETLTAETMAVAHMICSASARTLRIGKEAFQTQLDMTLEEAYAYTSEVMSLNMLDPDANEGIGAFLDKREAFWPSEQLAVDDTDYMDHEHYSDAYIRDILGDVKTIAMVGASANTVRPSYFVYRYLMDKGYRVIPVNPNMAGQELLGQTVYASLSDIPEPIDMVDIFRRSSDAAAIVDEALKLETVPKVIWMQLTVRDDEAAKRAERKGVKVVMNRCPKIEYGRLSGEIGWTGFNRRSISAKKPKLGSKTQTRNLFGLAVETAPMDEGDSLFD